MYSTVCCPFVNNTLSDCSFILISQMYKVYILNNFQQEKKIKLNLEKI
jgi:hypothetical protein